MRLKKIFYISLLHFFVVSFISCKSYPKYTYNYIGLEKFNGDTLHLWRATSDCLKSDKDYGKEPLNSVTIRNGKATFSGLIDTLHLYYIDGKDCSLYFYPESGKVTHHYMENTEYSNSQSVTKQYEILREKNFPRHESRRFMFANLQNAMGIYLLDHIGYYPNELDEIYYKSNPVMRDTVSLLLNLKQQLLDTKELNRGDMYINFKQRGFKQDSICFSNYFHKDNIICLFFANGNIKSFLSKMKEIKRNYGNVCFIGYSNKYVTDTNFTHHLESDYATCLFDDRGRYEKTVMYAYRMDYRIATNYYLIFSSDGRLIDKYIN